jgi:hypothetical protein
MAYTVLFALHVVLCSPLLVGLERRVVDNVADGAGRVRGETGVGGGPLPAALEVGGGDYGDGLLGEGEDLRGQAFAEVGGFAQVHLELRHQLLDVAQLRHHQPAAASVTAMDALHGQTSFEAGTTLDEGSVLLL